MSTATPIQRDAGIAKALTLDEARRIASNIAKLPNYSPRADSPASVLDGAELRRPLPPAHDLHDHSVVGSILKIGVLPS